MKSYTDETKEEGIFNEMWTGNWWNNTVVRVDFKFNQKA